jgi:uncharacterized membrane protein
MLFGPSGKLKKKLKNCANCRIGIYLRISGQLNKMCSDDFFTKRANEQFIRHGILLAKVLYLSKDNFAKALTIGALFSILTRLMKTDYIKNPLILSGILSALCVVIAFLDPVPIPGIEFITAAVFISGAVVGPGLGALVGTVAESMFSLFNPFGPPSPLLLFAQIFSFAIIGCCGGVVSKKTFARPLRRLIVLGFSGLILTLIFDVLTTLSFSVFIAGSDLKKTLAVFATGSLFYLTHLMVNVLIFIVVIPPVLSGIRSYQNRRENIA